MTSGEDFKTGPANDMQEEDWLVISDSGIGIYEDSVKSATPPPEEEKMCGGTFRNREEDNNERQKALPPQETSQPEEGCKEQSTSISEPAFQDVNDVKLEFSESLSPTVMHDANPEEGYQEQTEQVSAMSEPVPAEAKHSTQCSLEKPSLLTATDNVKPEEVCQAKAERDISLSESIPKEAKHSTHDPSEKMPLATVMDAAKPEERSQAKAEHDISVFEPISEEAKYFTNDSSKTLPLSAAMEDAKPGEDCQAKSEHDMSVSEPISGEAKNFTRDSSETLPLPAAMDDAKPEEGFQDVQTDHDISVSEPIIEEAKHSKQDSSEKLSLPMPDSWEPDAATVEEVQQILDDIFDVTGDDEAERFAMLQDYLEDFSNDLDKQRYLQRRFDAKFGSSADHAPGTTCVEPISIFARQKLALEELEKAKEIASVIDFNVFKQITYYSTQFNEQGQHIDNEGQFFFIDEHDNFKQEPFASMTRDQVFKLLKYHGNFKNLATSDLFTDDRQSKEFYFRASPKVPFFFAFHAYANIQRWLMEKYLTNPFNTACLVSYNQRVDLSELQPDDPSVERTIHLDELYTKFNHDIPNVLCIGTPCSRKSVTLNDLFGVQFETVQRGSIGLFHDAIDGMFNCKEFPTGFNVFDFQGFACKDYILLQELLKQMPKTLLLVLLSDLDYLDSVLRMLSEDLRKQMVGRTFVILRLSKEKDARSAKVSLKKIFPGLNLQSATFDLPDETSGEAYENKMQRALLAIQRFVDSNVDVLGEQLSKRIQAAAEESDRDILDYTKDHGSFWLMQDGLTQTFNDRSSQFQVCCMRQDFRNEHMRMKRTLYSIDDLSQLERKIVFPYYNKQLELSKIRKQLEDRSSLSSGLVERLEANAKELQRSQPHHNMLFTIFFENYMNGLSDVCADLLSQVEAHYLPRIKGQKKEVAVLKDQAEKIINQICQYEQNGEAKQDISEDSQQKYESFCSDLKQIKDKIVFLTDDIESKVLDSELFMREAKQYTYEEGGRKQSALIERMALEFENGRPLEIIDGDSNQINMDALGSIFQWVQALRKNNRKLLVITIMGPQSSGKSTLLNVLVGAKFHVSAGRCTKGLNAMLIRTDFEEIKEILVLDSEGLFSIEKQDPTYDRKLAIFCMSVSNLLLINIKGELNVEIQKVLEVAIYAINKIVQAKIALKVPHIKFVLRDQLETSNAEMEAAYTKLKNRMREAARASGTVLENVLRMPENAKDIVFMFTGAFALDEINQNKNLVLTKSQGVFRDQCSKLRLQILEMSKHMGEEEKNLDLAQWIQDSCNVWTAVQENEQLMMISDLAEINNHRELLKAVEQFRSIMGMAAPIDSNYIQYEHPFLRGKAEEFGQDAFILCDETIYAKFNAVIEEKMSEQVTKMITRDDLYHKQMQEMQSLKDDLAMQQQQYAFAYTRDFGPNLQNQARVSVNNIIESIYQKAMTKWKKMQSDSTITEAAQSMLKKLQHVVFEAKQSKKEFSHEDFKQEIKRHIDVTKDQIHRRFLKDDSQIAEEAFRHLMEHLHTTDPDKDNRKQEQDTEVVYSFLKPNRVKKINEPTLLDKQIDDSKSSYKEGCSVFDIPDEEPLGSMYYEERTSIVTPEEIQTLVCMNERKADEAVWTLIRDEPRYKQLSAPVAHLESKEKASWMAAVWNGWGGQKAVDPRVLRKQLNQRNALWQYLNSMTHHYKKYVRDEVSRKSINDFNMLRAKVQSCITHAQELNSQVLDMQPFPAEARIQLFKIFNNELERMQEEMRRMPIFNSKNDLIPYSIEYAFDRYEEMFTQTIFNQLYMQIERNEGFHKNHVMVILNQKAEEASSFFTKLNENVDGAKGVSSRLMGLLVEVACRVLAKACCKKLGHFLESGLRVEKSYTMQRAQQLFLDADDSPEGHEIIMDFMKEPIKLEKQICSERYDELALEEVQRTLTIFDQQIKSARANIQEFFDLFIQDFSHKTRSTTKLEDAHKLDFIMYIYASVLRQVGGEALNAFTAQKNKIEGYHIWDEPYVLPVFPKALFTLNQQVSDHYESLSEDQQSIKLQLVPQFNDDDVNMFLQFLDFAENEEVTQKIKGFRDKLASDLAAEVSHRQFYSAIENDALGCRGECPFCGARCEQITQCGSGVNHKSAFHRPMAFKGTHEVDKASGRKHLVQDFCTSQTNIESRWPKIKGSEMTNLLQRLRTMDLYTDGTNIYLEWSTGSDLDIQVKCPCGLWHGYGTSGGSGGACECNTCEMHRDYDIREGGDGRKAVEHVYFKDPKKLHKKSIGMAVYNFSNQTRASRNDFKLCMFNQHGYQLFPNAGSYEIQHQATWMFTSTSSKSRSREGFYEYKSEDDSKGIEDCTVKFPTHVKDHGHNWYFSAGDAATKKTDQKFINFIDKCNQKWVFVKSKMCAHYEAELLDMVYVL